MTRPHPLGDIRKHLTLLRNMAAETGADPELAFRDGRLDAEKWALAVTRCRDCRWVNGCHQWLETPEDRPRTVPVQCANAKMLEAMKVEL